MNLHRWIGLLNILLVSALCFTWFTPQPAFAQTNGLVAAYSFNEGSGTTVTDLSGNGNNGVINGATWTTGKYGGALSFNGSSSYVDLGNPASLQLTGSMTWSAWIYAAANPADDGQIVAKSDSSSGWQFKTSPDTGSHTFGVAVSPGSGSLTQRYSTTIRALNTWYHVAGVYNASAGTLNIYVNGVLDNGVLSGTIPSSQFNNSAVNVNIGRRTGGFYFNGIIDEVRIYNRALSLAEIQTSMNTPLGATSTISSCDLNQDTAVNVADVQLGVNMSLGLTPCTANIYGTGVCNVIVVQRLVNAALGGPCVTGITTTPHSVTLSWAASTSSNVTGYNVYRGSVSGGPYSKINSSLVSALNYTDSSVQGGTTYYYVVTAVDNTGMESSYSNMATAVVPSP